MSRPRVLPDPGQASTPSGTPRTPAATRTILLVQAEVEGVSALERVFTDGDVEGRRIVHVATVPRAIECLERSGRARRPVIDAVVCDLAAFGADEAATYRALQSHAVGIPVLALVERGFATSVDAAAPRSLFGDEESAQIMLEAIGDGVISTDRAGLITYCNPAAAQLTGWGADEAVGRPFVEVFRLIDAARRITAPDPTQRAMRDDAPASLVPDCLLARRDGTEIAVEDSVRPIHDAEGGVIGAVLVFRDVSALRAASLKMTFLAQHDALTDLPNRLLLTDRLCLAIELAQRRRQRLAVLYLDLDRFKYINDSLGHAVGDRLLQSVAQRLLGCTRGADTVSRQGGDEFVILLTDVRQLNDASVVAEKILQAVDEAHLIDGHELHITASLGIAVYPDDGGDDTTLLKNADAAMYHAKQSGRGNVQFFTESMNVDAVDRQLVESGLRRALKLDQLVLHYQPIIDLDRGIVVSAEALVRWNHPQRGLLLPAMFMRVAEESGCIVPMGRWILREACRQSRAWQDAGLAPLRIAVNTSALELRSKDFVESLRDLLAETGVAPDQLELEITETVLIDESEHSVKVLAAVVDMGIQLALDDFGTGYSSLNHLKRYPIGTLKIDRSFVHQLGSDPSNAGIVSAVIGLGESLHLRVVAEGVETPEEAAFLRMRGCPEAQGFFFGRPAEARLPGPASYPGARFVPA